ncbi:hypothetical protein ABZ646_23030 [Streptomyces sp. NPDC007162]|uniref:hypothetical protein n=1 Tax=Streptomyces sp. NPDC007162 TaxID=3156917 RepID=UPI0033FF343D
MVLTLEDSRGEGVISTTRARHRVSSTDASTFYALTLAAGSTYAGAFTLTAPFRRRVLP